MLQWVIDNKLQDIAVARKSPYFIITIGGKAGNETGEKPKLRTKPTVSNGFALAVARSLEARRKSM